MRTCDQPAPGWTVVLRRQPVRFVEGHAEGGYADMFELICCDCGDHPGLNFSDVSSELQRVRWPCPLAAGIAAYERHLTLDHEPVSGSPVPRMWVKAGETEMAASDTQWSEGHTAGPPTEGARAWANLL